MDVGFIGLGGMGKAIAINLLRAGHGITVWNRFPRLPNKGRRGRQGREHCR